MSALRDYWAAAEGLVGARRSAAVRLLLHEKWHGKGRLICLMSLHHKPADRIASASGEPSPRRLHTGCSLPKEKGTGLIRLRPKESARCPPAGGELALKLIAEGGKLFFRILAVYIMPYYSLIPRGR